MESRVATHTSARGSQEGVSGVLVHRLVVPLPGATQLCALALTRTHAVCVDRAAHTLHVLARAGAATMRMRTRVNMVLIERRRTTATTEYVDQDVADAAAAEAVVSVQGAH